MDFNNCMCDSQPSESQMQNDRNLLAPAERLKQLWSKSSCQEISGFADLFEKDIRSLVDVSDRMQMKLLLFLFSVWFNTYFKVAACD